MLLRPASEGTGVIAGGGVRAVLELGGVRNVLAKSLGTTNPINMAKATVVALQDLRRPEDVAKIRGKRISEVLPLPAMAGRRGRGRCRSRRLASPQAAVVEERRPSIEETPAEEPTAAEEPGRRRPRPRSLPPKQRRARKPAAEAPAAEKPKRRTLRRKKDDS